MAKKEHHSGNLSPEFALMGFLIEKPCHGYDLHRLVAGRPLILGGVRIPFELGLDGHSDADIVCHAVTDAVLGAAALGDIGRLFPDTEAAWKDADSVALLRTAMSRFAPERTRFLNRGDLLVKLFAMTVYTLSQQVDMDPGINRDGRLSFKWGGELFYQPLPYAFVALRYDRVVLDVQDDASGLRILTPRIGATVNWMLGAQIFLQYSRYWYGERVRLRPGQVALETLPDDNVLKLQAQISF